MRTRTTSICRAWKRGPKVTRPGPHSCSRPPSTPTRASSRLRRRWPCRCTPRSCSRPGETTRRPGTACGKSPNRRRRPTPTSLQPISRWAYRRIRIRRRSDTCAGPWNSTGRARRRGWPSPTWFGISILRGPWPTRPARPTTIRFCRWPSIRRPQRRCRRATAPIRSRPSRAGRRSRRRLRGGTRCVSGQSSSGRVPTPLWRRPAAWRISRRGPWFGPSHWCGSGVMPTRPPCWES